MLQLSVECLEVAAQLLQHSFVPFIQLHLPAPDQFFFPFQECTFQMIMCCCPDLAAAEAAVLKVLMLFIFTPESQMGLLVLSERFKHIDATVDMDLPLSGYNIE